MSLAKDIISGAGLSTSSLSLLDQSSALKELERISMSSNSGLPKYESNLTASPNATKDPNKNMAFSPRAAAINAQKAQQLQQVRPHSMHYERVKLIRQLRSTTSIPSSSKAVDLVQARNTIGVVNKEQHRRRSTKFDNVPSSGYGTRSSIAIVNANSDIPEVKPVSIAPAAGTRSENGTKTIEIKPFKTHATSLRNSVKRTTHEIPIGIVPNSRNAAPDIPSMVETVPHEGLDAVSSIGSVEASKDLKVNLPRPPTSKRNDVLTSKPPGMTKAQWELIQGVTGSLDRKPHVFVKR